MLNFSESKIESINNILWDRKKEKPIDKNVVGVGVRLHKVGIVKDGAKVCDIEELSRVIEELQMLKTTIEEETGLIL